MRDLVEHLIGQWVSVLVRMHHSCNILEVGSSLDLIPHRENSLHDHSFRRLQELVDEEGFLLRYLLNLFIGEIFLCLGHGFLIDELFLALKLPVTVFCWLLVNHLLLGGCIIIDLNIVVGFKCAALRTWNKLLFRVTEDHLSRSLFINSELNLFLYPSLLF